MNEILNKTLLIAFSLIGLFLLFPIMTPIIQNFNFSTINEPVKSIIMEDLETFESDLTEAENSFLNAQSNTNISNNFRFSGKILLDYDNMSNFLNFFFLYENLTTFFQYSIEINSEFKIYQNSLFICNYDILVNSTQKLLKFS